MFYYIYIYIFQKGIFYIQRNNILSIKLFVSNPHLIHKFFENVEQTYLWAMSCVNHNDYIVSNTIYTTPKYDVLSIMWWDNDNDDQLLHFI
jgi:hypothetical protein